MVLKCDLGALLARLEIVSRAVAARTSQPLTGLVRIEASAGRTLLCGSNPLYEVRMAFGAEVVQPGTTAIPAKLLASILGQSSAQVLSIALDDDKRVLHIEGFGLDTHINCEDPALLQERQSVECSDPLPIPLEDFLGMVGDTHFAASTEESRPVLTGVLVRWDGDALLMAATDGHRFAERRVSVMGKGEPWEAVIPARALYDAARALRGTGESVNVCVTPSANQALIKAEDAEIRSALLEGKFPDYAKQFPTGSATTAEVTSADLSRALVAPMAVAREGQSIIRLALDSGRLRISAATRDVGDVATEVSAVVQGTPIQVALNGGYLTDALVPGSEAKVVVSVFGPMAPVVLTRSAEAGFRYAIMPVRTSGEPSAGRASESSRSS